MLSKRNVFKIAWNIAHFFFYRGVPDLLTVFLYTPQPYYNPLSLKIWHNMLHKKETTLTLVEHILITQGRFTPSPQKNLLPVKKYVLALLLSQYPPRRACLCSVWKGHLNLLPKDVGSTFITWFLSITLLLSQGTFQEFK